MKRIKGKEEENIDEVEKKGKKCDEEKNMKKRKKKSRKINP